MRTDELFMPGSFVELRANGLESATSYAGVYSLLVNMK
jgi:hypothetical protein